MLTKKQVRDVCLHTNRNAIPEDMCRYCEYDYSSVFIDAFNCMKLFKGKKKAADANITTQIVAGIDPSLIPHSGDNCKGFLFLPNVKQGYDV